MIAFFTDPYEGELITHTIARYIEYEKSSASKVLTEIFLTPNITACLSFGNRIKELATIIGGKYDAEYLINNFTILPYYKLFCTKEKYQNLYEHVMIGSTNEKKRSTALIHVNSCLKNSVVYCGECVKEDIDLYGETYLHREHYLCGANTCYKHGTPLLEYEIIDNGFKTSLSKLNLVDKVYDKKALNIFQETYINSKRQTELAVKILNANIDIYREVLTEIYLSRLKDLGVIVKNNINYNKIYKMISDIYGEIGLTILRPHLDSKNITRHLFLNTKNFIEPSIHLLFIMVLWESSDLFIDKCIEQSSIRKEPRKEDVKVSKRTSAPVKRYRPEDVSTISTNGCVIKIVGAAHRYKSVIKNTMIGPWKCKDAICKNDIKTSTVSYDTSKKKLRQEVRCTCGCYYIVSIGVEEKEGENRIKIVDYSNQTKKIILEQYVNLGMGCITIGKKLGIPTRYIKKYLASENITQHVAEQYKMLEMELPITESEIANYFWKDYLDFIFDFPYTKKSILMKLLWDEYKSETKFEGNLEKVILDKHEKIINCSKSIIKDHRKKKRLVSPILKNNKLMRAIGYLRAYANNELEEIVLASSSRVVSDDDIDQLIKLIEDRRKNGIEVTRNGLRREYPKEMDYFYKNYPEKLDEVLPNKKSWGNELGINKKTKNRDKLKQSNADKDLQYELLIESISQQLRQRERPVRVTKTLISKKIGDAGVRKLDEKKYPRAVAAINRVCESLLEYKLRVCKQVIDKMDLSSEYVSLNAIFYKANIKDPKIYKDTNIREEVARYLEERKNNCKKT